ncbi:hypothetical protein GOP47_0001121 [Adiantum capillus-veneris]|uniref:mRNA (guanine-N(7))-methyltransferase n=1 Tax=Adiantum capillus-veneris TaxID=13818 RepID=A0A9D4VDR1_ADICA|nr:hypothetical protein GOP47_0000324 [Adiantum capillus-veneris]KAI5084952.1 hypothetical protein GOP47_0001121 [Adiantum capillus-veneris]
MASQALPGYPAHHLNSRTSGTLQARLHNFVKYALLQQLVPPGSTVCDLYCGQGTDTAKWAQAQIGRYVGVDIATSTLEEAREQWNNLNRPYSADFCEVDPSLVSLEIELKYMGLPADFVTCMGRLQDSFLKEEMVRSLLHNVVSVLKPGGYFFGITADSSTIWSKFQKAVEGAHRAGVFRALPRVHSEHYTISFDDDRFTPFGTRYTLQFADGVIFDGQQLIHFPSFIRLAEEVGLECIELQNLQEFYDDYRLHFPDLLRATCTNLVDPKGRLPHFAHDILSLYTTFIFKKSEYLDPDYMLSPFPAPDEEQLELCSKDAYDGYRASFQDNFLPAKEIDIVPKSLPTTFQQNEAREACVARIEEEKRPHPTALLIEENMHLSPRGSSRKEIVSVVDNNSSYKQSDCEGSQEVKLDLQAVVENVTMSGRKGDNESQTSEKSLELPDVAMVDASTVPSDCLADKEHPHLVTYMEGQVSSELPPEVSIINSGSPLKEVLQHRDAIDEVKVSQQQVNVGDEGMREAPTTTDAIIEEIPKEKKEQGFTENLVVVENVPKQSNVHASLPSEDPSRPIDGGPPAEDPPPVVTEDRIVADIEAKEIKVEKVSNLQSDNVKKEILKEPEVSMHADAQKLSSPATDDNKSSAKGRANPATREETYSGFNKRLNAGSDQHYRSGRPHHYHLHVSHSEERQEHSHGSRHHSHPSHKVSRDRVGDHRSELPSPGHRGDSRRGRGRSRSNAHAPPPAPSPTFVPFSHFVPQTEFPIFHSPNTPGILGPGPPPVLLIEPICPLWPIPPPLERRVFPKTRTPRKHGNDRDSSASRSRRESPKRHWKDSPPPGTES